ncbi:MAG: hypothetical protein Q8L87_11435 [Anaerolineales bacterium]|jgi:hypothetical protein|nr:hypothetical protein [Anaerolineales bacterium]
MSQNVLNLAVRFLLELAALYAFAGWVFGSLTLLHYLLSYDRILWLLKS